MNGKMRYAVGAIEIVAFLAMLAQTVLFARQYAALPPAGEAERFFASQEAFLALFLLGMAVYGMLFVLKRFPRIMKYPVPITPKNVVMQASLSRLMLSANTLLAAAILLAAQYAACPGTAAPRAALLVAAVLFVLMLVNTAVYFALAFRFR